MLYIPFILLVLNCICKIYSLFPFICQSDNLLSMRAGRLIVGICRRRKKKTTAKGLGVGESKGQKSPSPKRRLYSLRSNYFENGTLSHSFETLQYQNSTQLSLGGCRVLSEGPGHRLGCDFQSWWRAPDPADCAWFNSGS